MGVVEWQKNVNAKSAEKCEGFVKIASRNIFLMKKNAIEEKGHLNRKRAVFAKDKKHLTAAEATFKYLSLFINERWQKTFQKRKK